MLTDAALEALDRSLMLGTARQPADLQRFGIGLDPRDDKAVLKALALAGQQKRFRRRSMPRNLVTAAPVEDARPILPAAARTLLRRLLIGKNGNFADAAALAIADSLGRRKMRLHPFDLPRLSGFVRENAANLGTSARAWVAALGTSETKAGFFEADALDETNWQQARPAERAAFIRRLRATEPATARHLLEQAIAAEQAPVRLQLIKTLAEGLSAADRDFLESFSADRSQLVRDAVDSLLSRIPGTPAAEKRLKEFLSRIKIGKAGLLRRRSVLSLEFPANVSKQQEAAWTLGAMAGLSLNTLASALNMSTDELIESVEDKVLLVAFAQRAAAARRFDLLAGLVRRGAKDAWVTMIAFESDDLDFANEGVRANWCAAALDPNQWQIMPSAQTLMRLYEVIRMPLPDATAQALFSSMAWRNLLDGAANIDAASAAELLTAIAALAPESYRKRMRQGLAPLPATHNARAALLLDLLDAIEMP